MSVVAQKPLGASFEQIEVLLTMLMVSYEAMQGSGHAWPPIAEALQERCLERITQELRSTEGIAAVQRDRIIQLFLAGHSEPLLLAYVYGQLAEHGLSKVTDDGAQFVILAALNLVECIAEAAKLRAGS